MPRNIGFTIGRVFENCEYIRTGSWYGRNTPQHNSKVLYMDIPIDEDVFEIPTFAFSTFCSTIASGRDEETSALIVSLDTQENMSQYKSIDRALQDILVEDFCHSRLILIPVKQGDSTVNYYGTHGALFDKDFKPLAICSYQIERFLVERENEDGETDSFIGYKLQKAILRVAPWVYLYKDTAIEKYIVNKMITGCLQDMVSLPPRSNERILIKRSDRLQPIVEICNCPFNLHLADTPSISTTNQQLLQVALDHIEEVMQ